MPTVTLNKKSLLGYIGKKLKDDDLRDRISMLGTGLEEINEENVIVEVFPNRPDLLSEQGMGRALSTFVGVSSGLKKYKVEKSGLKVYAKNLPKEWPYVVAGIVKGIEFNDDRIKEIIQIQEKLGITLLRKRKKGGIGLYPLEQITFPVTFTSKNPDELKFRPLEYPDVITGRQILSKHPTGREYAHLCENWEKYPFFHDSKNQIMSMPPIINSHDMGKVKEDTRNVFVECTGTDLKTIEVAFNIMMTSLADMDGKLFSLEIIYDSNKIGKLNTPNLEPSKMKFDLDYINRYLGLDLKSAKKYLEMMGYGVEGNNALVPAYRADILHPIDLVEDIAIAYGYENLKEEIPKVATIAAENKVQIFKRKIANILIGLGLIEVHTYNIVSKESVSSKMEVEMNTVDLANALNMEFNVLRSWMIPSLMHVFTTNRHNEYPQQIFGFGNVFKDVKDSDTGVKEEWNLAVALCDKDVNYTKIKQVLDIIFDALDLKYTIKEVEHNSFISGRVGEIILENNKVGFIGEIHPKVLENWGLEMPVVALELNIKEIIK